MQHSSVSSPIGVRREGVGLHSWHGSSSAWPRERSTPRARRGTPKACGVDGEGARRAIMGLAMLRRVISGPRPDVVSRFIEVAVGRVWFDPKAEPLSVIRPLAASTYIRPGHPPYQGPSCNGARARGLQGGWDPSTLRHIAATLGYRSHIHLGIGMFLSSSSNDFYLLLRAAPAGTTPVST